MFVLVVTGGIGAGKSVAVEQFRDRGAVVLDLDALAAEVLALDDGVRAALRREFGEAVMRPDGEIDRGALARAAFSTLRAAERLGEIVHPEVVSRLYAQLESLRALPEPPSLVVVDVPLLAEVPTLARVGDRVLAISAPEEVRIARAVARGMAEGDVRARVACQASDSEREGLADDVIVNDGSIESFRARLSDYWDGLVSRDES